VITDGMLDMIVWAGVIVSLAICAGAAVVGFQSIVKDHRLDKERRENQRAFWLETDIEALGQFEYVRREMEESGCV
jgi:peroxiredoxin family protein